MSNIWQDPFGLNLFKSTKTKKCPSSVPDQPKTHYHPMPCPRMPAMQQLIYSEVIYTQITSPTICYQVQPSQSATNCHCNHTFLSNFQYKQKLLAQYVVGIPLFSVVG
ncbi:hypothetical protein BD408DRAFT_487058 [Parasitella parasitica]|nr:hypothetical protein BD408DRAFT_487058 [Parasitella parasitica]